MRLQFSSRYYLQAGSRFFFLVFFCGGEVTPCFCHGLKDTDWFLSTSTLQTGTFQDGFSRADVNSAAQRVVFALRRLLQLK